MQNHTTSAKIYAIRAKMDTIRAKIYAIRAKVHAIRSIMDDMWTFPAILRVQIQVLLLSISTNNSDFQHATVISPRKQPLSSELGT